MNELAKFTQEAAEKISLFIKEGDLSGNMDLCQGEHSMTVCYSPMEIEITEYTDRHVNLPTPIWKDEFIEIFSILLRFTGFEIFAEQAENDKQEYEAGLMRHERNNFAGTIPGY